MGGKNILRIPVLSSVSIIGILVFRASHYIRKERSSFHRAVSMGAGRRHGNHLPADQATHQDCYFVHTCQRERIASQMAGKCPVPYFWRGPVGGSTILYHL
jgi:hypothetical protein